ncbi:MFS transporter [Streptomyces cinnamoneus]|uniref:MFS transporter n=1 Tax=Streptomyces cinnamoneus TaxID=53446 RepID=UPI001E33C2FC|nr:MFS transporter [Streptomyces cinnamoneus]
MPRLLVVQNDPRAGAGRLGDWLTEDGLELEVIAAYDGAEIPARLEHRALLVLGGGYLPDEDGRAPWLARTRALVAQALETGAPVLGICLGGQLLAHVAGGTVRALMAVITVPTALGPVLGPVLGGLVLHLADWRWLFFVNIPFCVVGGWLARRDLPDDRPAPDRPHARLDVVGLLLLCPGFAALVHGLSQAEGGAGFAGAKVLIPLISGLTLVGGFIAWALTRTTGALVNVRLFRHRAVASSSTLLFLGGISLFGSMMLLPLYLQQVRGENALGAGLLLIPQGVGALLARSLAGKYTDRIGPRGVAVAAFAFVAAATVPFAFVTADTSEVLLMAALFVRGIALGAAVIAPMGAAYVRLEHEEIPDASIITRVTQQIGGAVGVAVLAVVLQHSTGDAHTPSALADGFGTAFWWSVAFTAAAVPLCLLLPSLPEPTAPDDGAAEAEAAVHGPLPGALPSEPEAVRSSRSVFWPAGSGRGHSTRRPSNTCPLASGSRHGALAVSSKAGYVGVTLPITVRSRLACRRMRRGRPPPRPPETWPPA